MPKDPQALVWLDLETTGIDDRTSVILEIATIITDKELAIVAEGPDLVIHQPDRILASMVPWCIEQHGKSGLTEASRRSKVSLAEAEEKTLAFVRSHCLRGRAPLCGNSIGFDRRFLLHHMPTLNDYLHYRNVDVSSVKELVARWYQQPPETIEKESAHRALDDIRESIEELRLYRRLAFRGPS
ncbi:MAG: oligoribonuclease [Candidatus Bipolaricaulota bacterium]|nr:MAG: oligoribonuclease [Candidatus Bipolaricaulota bacterium]